MKIINPIIPGFHPDPSILRVGEDYYIATSTFEWFPGVRIFHSRNLTDWNLVATPLDRLSQLDLIGNPDSGGVWAPCLSYSNGLFYLIYTDTKLWDDCPYKTCHNYLVTSSDINGPWSDPVYLNSSGFDPSLFHDSDGRKWLVNMEWDHRPGRNTFSGILIQEYSESEQKLVGGIKKITRGTELGCVEGPHLYLIDGWYYLLLAEGGTGYKHACSIARARNLEGPYQFDPDNPFLTSADDSNLTLQKAGHGSLVEGPDGSWYLAHLCSRPVKNTRRCVLGRETAIQRIYWNEEGWPRLFGGSHHPQDSIQLNLTEPSKNISANFHYEFLDQSLNIDFQSLRQPQDSTWISLAERKGCLRLKGAEPLSSLFRQSLVGRRIQHFCCEAETELDYLPVSFQQTAGLTAYYDTKRHFHLCVGCDDNGHRTLNIWYRIGSDWGFLLEEDIILSKSDLVRLKIKYQEDKFFYAYKDGEDDWVQLDIVSDATWLSDDSIGLGFTGAFFCMSAQDLTGQSLAADFSYFSYRELPQ